MSVAMYKEIIGDRVAGWCDMYESPGLINALLLSGEARNRSFRVITMHV